MATPAKTATTTPSAQLLAIQGTLSDVKSKISAVFQDRLFIEKIALKTLATNSPAFTIPKRIYYFYIGDLTIATNNQYFPYLNDILAHLQRKAAGRLELHVAERENSLNITAILDGEVAILRSDGYFGGLFGIPEDDDRKCTISCGHSKIVHVFKKPILSATVNMFLINCSKKNEIDTKGQTSFRIATIPSSHDRIIINNDVTKLFFHDLHEDMKGFEIKIVWSDGLPFVTHNPEISIVLAYI